MLELGPNDNMNQRPEGLAHDGCGGRLLSIYIVELLCGIKCAKCGEILILVI